MILPSEVEKEILTHAGERRACLGVVARHVSTGEWRVVRMKGATAKDVRRVYRDLMAHAEYVAAVYRGGRFPPKPVRGLAEEEAPYLWVDAAQAQVVLTSP